MQYPIRINAYLRDKGLASRREADRIILAGHVFVNGVRATPGMRVVDGDEVVVSGEEKRILTYLAYYKPRGLATQGAKGAPSVIETWRVKGIFPVGRLDKESEGLLILTNDGRVTTSILDKERSVEKEYLVEVREPLRSGIPAIFKKGMDTKTFGKLLPADAELLDSHTLTVILREGKHHQVRVMLGELGHTVTRLTRVRVGKIVLGKLKPGATRALGKTEINFLLSVDK